MADRIAIISRSPAGAAADGRGAPGDRRQFEDELASRLVALGLDVVTVPHIYHLSAGEPAVRQLAQEGGIVATAAWLHPRATQWTLAFLGLTTAEARVRCADMGAFATPEECAMSLAGADEAERTGAAREPAVESRERWYPVLDYERCTQCGRCRDFCLFGVYDRDEGWVVVSQPDKCKPGCPACARVCPSGAIMFPHYDSDPGIAGAPGAAVSSAPIDVDAFYRLRTDGPRPDAPCPVCGCACDCPRYTAETAPEGAQLCPACGCICDDPGSCACDAPDDDLKDLIDALADFDE